jgi:hypothetical protein
MTRGYRKQGVAGKHENLPRITMMTQMRIKKLLTSHWCLWASRVFRVRARVGIRKNLQHLALSLLHNSGSHCRCTARSREPVRSQKTRQRRIRGIILEFDACRRLLGTRIGVGVLAACEEIAKLGCVDPIIGDEKMWVGGYKVGGIDLGVCDASIEVSISP